MKKKLISILIGFPIIIGISIIVFTSISYFGYMATQAQSNKWTELPSPPQKVSKILAIQSLRDVFVKTETGEVFHCPDGQPICSAWAGAEPARACVEGDIGVPAYLPHGKIIDSCIYCTSSACSVVLQVSDNSLWLRIFEQRAVSGPSEHLKTGLILGGLIGGVIWAVWAINTLIKAFDERYQI